MKWGANLAAASLRNISAGGLQVEGDGLPGRDTFVSLFIDGLNVSSGEVAWASGKLAGIEFMEELSWASIMPWIRDVLRGHESGRGISHGPSSSSCAKVSARRPAPPACGRRIDAVVFHADAGKVAVTAAKSIARVQLLARRYSRTLASCFAPLLKRIVTSRRWIGAL